MKKMVSLLLGLLLMSFVVLSGCSSEPAEESASGASASGTAAEVAALQTILDQGYFTYGLEAQYRPFEYRDENDEIVGYDIDLANEIGRRMGVEARPVDTSWGAVIQSLYDGQFDVIIGGMTATEERYERVDFSVPYMDQGSGLLVHADGGIESREDLEGKMVGAGEGTPSVTQLEDTATELGLTYAEDIKTYDDDASAYEAMRTDRLDAYASSFVSLNEFAKENPEFTVVPFTSESWPSEYAAIAFRQEDVALRAIMNGILIEMKEDGTLAELQNKWFGTTFDTPNVPPVW